MSDLIVSSQFLSSIADIYGLKHPPTVTYREEYFYVSERQGKWWHWTLQKQMNPEISKKELELPVAMTVSIGVNDSVQIGDYSDESSSESIESELDTKYVSSLTALGISRDDALTAVLRNSHLPNPLSSLGIQQLLDWIKNNAAELALMQQQKEEAKNILADVSQKGLCLWSFYQFLETCVIHVCINDVRQRKKTKRRNRMESLEEINSLKSKSSEDSTFTVVYKSDKS